jgi:lipid-binding SYLF domain-containing protein
VFPRVGSAGFVVGGGGGAGVFFENGRPVHYAELNHFDAGALAGGQKYAEIVILNNRDAINDLRSGRFDVGARASAVMLRSGAGAGVTFDKGVAVVVEPLGGAMVNASLRGQNIRLTL